ncbi:MAG TPA: hypothetical protein VJ866_18290 [Pyrinomonadaceae bacterium]|nr:hypothetical protein [Pyrinomonadaceae bacterium]
MKRRQALLPLALVVCALAAVPARGQDEGPANGPFWVYARIEVNTTRKTPDGEKHESRVYVSNLVSVSADVWDNLLRYKAKENVSAYFDATVGKAAEARGEELSYYDQDVEWDCTCVGTSNEVRPKSDVEEKRNEVIQTAKENEHPVVFFNWDPTGKNKERDAQGELKKNTTPPAKAPTSGKKPSGSN